MPTKPGRKRCSNNFKGGSQDGATPHATLFRDGAGDLYGTTTTGGSNTKLCDGGRGIVFKLSRSGTSWRETILHRFSGGADGTTPYPGVVVDAIGKVYGATTGGGIATAGTVYEISPTSTGGRKHTVLHNFAGKPDAATPYATPRLDAAGNLYGATYAGGTSNSGTVYKLTCQPGGSWTEQVIHSFSGGRDGTNPFAAVTFDRAGNIYGNYG